MKRLLFIFVLFCIFSTIHAESIWTEGFETTFPPAGWVTNSIDQTSTYAFTGSYSVRLNSTGDYLITPPISSAQTLIFWTYTTAADPAIVVEYSAAANGPWTEAAGSPFSGYTEQWNGQFIDISSPGTVYIRFRKSGSGTLYIDDVSLENGIPTRNQPPVFDPLGDQTVFENQPLVFSVSASDPADNDPVTLSATNLPLGAVFTNEVFVWNHAGPPGDYTATFYAADKDGTVSKTLCITVSPLPQLLISEVADPAGTGGDTGRFVELYNVGSTAIDLAANSWTLSKQINGGTWYDFPLTGTVAAASVQVIACNADDFQAVYGFMPHQSSGTVSGNGDDAYFLYCGGNHTNGALVDLYGEVNTDGSGTAWDYEDSRAVRKNYILQPNPLWAASEWIITSGAEPARMNPGSHGPAPEFQGLENPFVFPGDDLTLAVTAINTVRTDIITLSATALPAGATFTPVTGTNTVSSCLKWNSPTAGVYTATFAAAGFAGTNTVSVLITVSGHSQIYGKFYGWSGDTIFKLTNGQFWQQCVPGAKTASPPLYRPTMTITNVLGTKRMIVTSVTGYVVVTPLTVAESTVTNAFTGLRNGNIYPLADRTVWRQISFETIPSSADPVTVWRWIIDGRQMLRFIDRNDVVIGTCIAEAAAPPADTKTRSKVSGYFYGFGYGSVFRLADGSWWKQISFERSAAVHRNPDVLVWNTNGLDYLEMPDENRSVTVEKLNVCLESTVTNSFTGLHYGNLYPLTGGGSWIQLSFEHVSTNMPEPKAVLWKNGTQTTLLIRDSRDVTIGTCTVADSNADSDNDGLSNTAEVLAGVDPLDAQSRFDLRQTNHYVLNWNAVECRIYTIEWTPSLARPFQILENSIAAPQNSWTDTVHSAEARGYYRISVRLAD
jgi:hypothetical protein